MRKFMRALGQAIVDGWMIYSDSICRKMAVILKPKQKEQVL